MRLLFTLPLLLAVSTIMGAPTPASEDWPTTIEIIYENVTRTVIHEVTEPTLVEATEAETQTETEVETTTEANVSLTDARKKIAQLEKELKDAHEKVDALNKNVELAKDAVVAATEETAVEETTVAVNTTARVCNCDESKACREESKSAMGSCMTECEASFEEWGNVTSYTTCFAKNNASILEAEECLFKDQTEKACKSVTEEVEAHWTEMEDIKFQPSTEIKDTDVWHKYQPKYNKIQDFFHCTKHCMHKKLGECTAEKKCNFKLPAHDDFAKQMTKCTKDNVKISNALLTTCTCLAWTEKIKEFQGTCGMIGNHYYIGKA